MPSHSHHRSPLFAKHTSEFAENHYVYPVLSRRAGGISIGINLNLDKLCTFHCVYCQVDHTEPGKAEKVDLTRLAEELDAMLEEVASGDIFAGPKFRDTPPPLRRLNDIAFSGDGEPTACGEFDAAVEVCAEALRRRKLHDVKLVVITNASLLHRPRVQKALKIIDAVGGEIWAKLDAGTEGYYRTVDRSDVPWRRILDNLRDAALERPIVIQTLFSRLHDEPPRPAEIEAYCDRLQEILAAGGRIKVVQIHTIARQPAEAWVTPLANAEIDALADVVRRRTGLSVAAFYS